MRTALIIHEIGLARTTSRRGGGFFLCNLGPAAVIHVSKVGFNSQNIGPIDTSITQVLEIELTRP